MSARRKPNRQAQFTANFERGVGAQIVRALAIQRNIEILACANSSEQNDGQTTKFVLTECL